MVSSLLVPFAILSCLVYSFRPSEVSQIISPQKIILIQALTFMFTPIEENPKQIIPQVRRNNHFRIRSASKEKATLSRETQANQSCKRDTLEGPKRIYSENQKHKIPSGQPSIRIRITKQELQKRFETATKKNLKKNSIYQSVKTEDDAHVEQNRVYNSHTIDHDEVRINFNKLAKICDPNQILNNFNSNYSTKWNQQPEIFKKMKNQKELKVRYRCRVNQFVFESNRKKTGHNRQQQQSLDQFWKNVNQSLILAGNQAQQLSKDMQQFVEHFVAE